MREEKAEELRIGAEELRKQAHLLPGYGDNPRAAALLKAAEFLMDAWSDNQD